MELVSLAYLHTALDQLVDVKERLLEQLSGVGENAHKALFLQNEEAMGAVSTMHRCNRLAQLTQHLLHAVAVVFVLPERKTEMGSNAAGDFESASPLSRLWRKLLAVFSVHKACTLCKSGESNCPLSMPNV